MKNKRNTLIIGIMTAGLVIALGSCLKTNTPQPIPPQTYISVMNLAVIAPSAELYFNAEKVTQAMPSGSVFAAYSGTDPGNFEVKFKKAGSDSLIAGLPAMNYDSMKYYTLLTYNDQQNGVKAARIEDNFSNLTNDKAYYRFFNMSADVNAVDLFIQSAKLASARTPADNIMDPNLNRFTAFEPGSYQVVVKKAGTDSVLAQMNASLAAANAYTFFVKGLASDSGSNKLTLAVLRAAD